MPRSFVQGRSGSCPELSQFRIFAEGFDAAWRLPGFGQMYALCDVTDVSPNGHRVPNGNEGHAIEAFMMSVSPSVKRNQLMGHYQEEGIGAKGFTSDRGSILKESPETLRARTVGSRGAPEGCSRGHEEIPRPMTDFENVILYLQAQ